MFKNPLPAELIDTLWNVNIYAGVAYGIDGYELIDTLWNVNEGAIMVS